jgi:hypothetical protein
LASPEVEGPVASPGTEVDASPVVDEPIDDAAATPVLEEPTETAEPTEITDQVASPEVVEPTATETLAPTGTEPTAEPTAAISTGFISGTDGDSVNCRLSPVDGEVIASLTAGDVVDVTGPVEDGWYPVSCDGRAGYVAADYITLGSLPGEAVTEPTSTVPSQSDATPTDVVTATIEPTLEPTATVEPTETPYPIYDTGDTETSNTAWLASDDDASTYWSVYPSISPEQTRLYLDLGSVLPIDRITIELAVGGMLPVFEIWLSEDAATWYNATPQGINGWNLWADEAHVFRLGYDARYIRLVIPNVDESGLGEVGGIRQVTVWPGDIDETQFLTALGSPTTPTPAPVPKEDVIPTDVPVTTIAGDVVPTTEPTPADDGGQGVDSNQQDQALPPGDGGGVEKDGTPTDAGS